MGTFSLENTLLWGGVWGLGRRKFGIFTRRIPRVRVKVLGGQAGYFPLPKSPERDWSGEAEGWKNGNKKRARSDLLRALFNGHYSRDIMFVLNQTLSTSVSVFFKTNTLSEHFVTLSAERCPFPAWFPTSKNSISATFSPIFLCLSAPAFFPFRWHLRTRHPPSKSPAFPPFIFSFRGRPSQPPSPQQFPLSSSLSERPTDRIYTQNQTVPFKIEAFPGGSSLAQGRRKGLFRGILEYLGSKNRPRSGRFLGAVLGRISGTFPP